MHEHLRGAMVDYMFDGKAMSRQKDPVAKSLMDQLIEDYRTTPHGRNGEFFNSSKKGLQPFMIKYMVRKTFFLNFKFSFQSQKSLNTLNSIMFFLV